MNVLYITLKLLKGSSNQISEEGLKGGKPSKKLGLGQSKVRAALSLLNGHISCLRFLWLFILFMYGEKSTGSEVWRDTVPHYLYDLGQVN